MRVSAKYLSTATALAAMLCGCGAPSWRQFDTVVVGRVLPATYPGPMEHTVLGAGYIGSPGGEGSFFGSDMRLAAVLGDTEDSAIAKACLSVQISHRIAYIQTSYRYVIEALVGSNLRSDDRVSEALTLVALASQPVAAKPSDRHDSKLSDSQRIMPPALGEVSRCISLMDQALVETRGPDDDSNMSRMRRRKFTGASIRFSKALNQSLEIKLAGKRIEERLASLPGGFGGPDSRTFIPRSIPEAMLYKHVLLNSLTRPSKIDNEKQVHKINAMYSQYAHPRVVELLGSGDTFRGAQEDGFSRKWRTLDGVTVQIGRTGPVVRAEISGLIVRDPVMTDADMGDTERTAAPVDGWDL